MASNHGHTEGPASHENSTCIDDATDIDSKAAFAVYRPEIRGIPDPLTYREAIRKYKRQAQPMNIDHHANQFKKRLVARAHRKTNSNAPTVGNVGMRKFIGETSSPQRSPSKTQGKNRRPH